MALKTSVLFRKNARWIKSKLKKDRIVAPPVSTINFDKQIVTVASSEIILQHAKTQKNVVFAGLENWFSSDNKITTKILLEIFLSASGFGCGYNEAAFQSRGENLQKNTLCVI